MSEESEYLRRMAPGVVEHGTGSADLVQIHRDLRTFCPKEQPGFVVQIIRDLEGLDLTPEELARWCLDRAERLET